MVPLAVSFASETCTPREICAKQTALARLDKAIFCSEKLRFVTLEIWQMKRPPTPSLSKLPQENGLKWPDKDLGKIHFF